MRELYELPRRFEEAGPVHDRVASIGGQVWVKGNELVRLGREWEGVV